MYQHPENDRPANQPPSPREDGAYYLPNQGAYAGGKASFGAGRIAIIVIFSVGIITMAMVWLRALPAFDREQAPEPETVSETSVSSYQALAAEMARLSVKRILEL